MKRLNAPMFESRSQYTRIEILSLYFSSSVCENYGINVEILQKSSFILVLWLFSLRLVGMMNGFNRPIGNIVYNFIFSIASFFSLPFARRCSTLSFSLTFFLSCAAACCPPLCYFYFSPFHASCIEWILSACISSIRNCSLCDRVFFSAFRAMRRRDVTANY